MGQDDRMGFGVREIKRAPENVAQFMMYAHPNETQTSCTEPSAVKCIRASFRIGFVGDNDREGACEGAVTLFSHKVDDGVAVLGVKGFDCVSDGVYAACSAEAFRQREREVDVVDDDFR